MIRWYPSASRFPEGECVRLHAPSGGDSYVEKVRLEECRPAKVSLLWLNNNCYEVDAETQGKSFGMRLKSPHPCAPADALYSFDASTQTCYLVDSSGGLKFKAKLELRECEPPKEELKLSFVLDKERMLGACFEIHRTLGEARWKRKTETYRCRPKETYFAWKPKGQFEGECWEVSMLGAEDFLDRTAAKNCRPEKVEYLFERKAEKYGDCFEVDSETQGQKWSQRVAASLCRKD
jgi:hypothetical protein